MFNNDPCAAPLERILFLLPVQRSDRVRKAREVLLVGKLVQPHSFKGRVYSKPHFMPTSLARVPFVYSLLLLSNWAVQCNIAVCRQKNQKQWKSEKAEGKEKKGNN